MKLKNRDLTERERRLTAVDTPLLQQDRLVRAALLTIVLFGVSALAGVVGYLVRLYLFRCPDTRAKVAMPIETQRRRFHSVPFSTRISLSSDPKRVKMLVDGRWIDVPPETIQYVMPPGDTGGGHWCGQGYEGTGEADINVPYVTKCAILPPHVQ